jgi:hypothetical protein
MRVPSRSAAMCGAIGSRSNTGVTSPRPSRAQPAALIRATLSSLASTPSWPLAPAAMGFNGATLTPRAYSA